MKTKVLVLMVLLIAIAAMVAPVMAAKTVGLEGTKEATVTFEVPNSSVTFASFATGTHHISPTTSTPVVTIQLATDDPVWHVYAYDSTGNAGFMKSTHNTLGTALAVKLANDAPSGSTGHDIAALSATATTKLLENSGNAVFPNTLIDLDLAQVVAASDPAGIYSTTLTLDYGAN